MGASHYKLLGVLRTVPHTGKTVSNFASCLRLARKIARKKAGITDLRFHDLRHEEVSRFFEVGMSIPEVTLISAHKDVRQLFRYTHLNTEDVFQK